MDNEQFRELAVNRMGACLSVLTAKNVEYSRGGDKLHNFKRAGAKLGCSPARALLGMKSKHDVSVDDLVADMERGSLPSREMVAEKIGDSINYLLLLEGIIEEARGEEGGCEPL